MAKRKHVLGPNLGLMWAYYSSNIVLIYLGWRIDWQLGGQLALE